MANQGQARAGYANVRAGLASLLAGVSLLARPMADQIVMPDAPISLVIYTLIGVT